MRRPTTLVVDVGGTTLKAITLDARGAILSDLVRVPTSYPMDPDDLATGITKLAATQGPSDRVTIGFPGMVRGGRVLTAPEFVTVAGLGSAVRDDLVAAWTDLDLANELAATLERPTQVVNDADLRGLGVAAGVGLELVVTLGAGFGTALLSDGRLCPHLEFAHDQFRDGQTYNEQLGQAARRRMSDEEWTARVAMAIDGLDRLVRYDRVWVLGGNARWLTDALGPKATIVTDPAAGLEGGVRIWC